MFEKNQVCIETSERRLRGEEMIDNIYPLHVVHMKVLYLERFTLINYHGPQQVPITLKVVKSLADDLAA